MKVETRALRALGLTEYGARAYATLVALGPSGAATLAEAAPLPRTKVYQVLRELTRQGWVEVDMGRPRLYRALPPRECFQRERQRLDGLMDQAVESLDSQHRQRSTRFAGALWLVEGGRALAEKSVQMVEAARREIILVASFELPGERDLARALRRAVARGVRVRLAAADPELPHVRQLLVAGAEFRALALPPRFLYVDGTQVLLALPPTAHEREPKGIHNPSPELLRIMGPFIQDLLLLAEPVPAAPTR